MKKLTLVLFSVALLASCAPKLSFTWTKDGYAGRKYNKIAVFSRSTNQGRAVEFQDAMVKEFAKKGYNAVAGISIINPMMGKNLTVEDFQRIMTKEGIDAVISVAVVDKETSVDYVPGTNYGMAYGAYGYRGYYGYYGARFGGMYHYDPGYYQENKTYLIENLFYEINTGQEKDDALLWASQSELTNPSKSTGRKYAMVLVDELIKGNIIK